MEHLNTDPCGNWLASDAFGGLEVAIAGKPAPTRVVFMYPNTFLICPDGLHQWT
jgi:hypothetical protein